VTKPVRIVSQGRGVGLFDPGPVYMVCLHGTLMKGFRKRVAFQSGAEEIDTALPGAQSGSHAQSAQCCSYRPANSVISWTLASGVWQARAQVVTTSR